MLNREDSIAKHKRNIIFAVCVIATLIFFPIGLPFLALEMHREILIRWLNKHEGAEIPYTKCIELAEIGKVLYGGKEYVIPAFSYDED